MGYQRLVERINGRRAGFDQCVEGQDRPSFTTDCAILRKLAEPLIATFINPLNYTSDRGKMTKANASETQIESIKMMCDSMKAGAIRLGTKGQYRAFSEAEEQIRLLYNRIGKTYNDEDKLHGAR